MTKFSNIVPCWNFVLETQIEPIKKEDRPEAYNILVEESFDEFLEYARDKGAILSDRILTYLQLECYDYEINSHEYLNYYEENYDKRNQLLDVLFDYEIDEYTKELKEPDM